MRDTPKDMEKDQKNSYRFLKETIHKPPLTAGQRRTAVLHMIGFGLILGGAFALGNFGITKLIRNMDRQQELKHPQISLSESEVVIRHENADKANYAVNGIESMGYFEQVYEEAKKLAEEPLRSLVHVFSYSNDEDLLNHTLYPKEDSLGLIFLDSSENYYIFTTTAEPYREKTAVTFADGSVTEAIPCGYDPDNGYMVVRVPQERMREQTKAYISVTALYPGEIEDPASVIAVGDLQGHNQSVLYGVVISDELDLYCTDNMMEMFTTNIYSSTGSSGIILNRFGDCVGWIHSLGENDRSVSAIKSRSIREIAEILANDETIRYFGIRGSDISEIQSQSLGIPMGIYVDSFEINSPAAERGVQIGDIITGINGTPIKTVKEYAAILQTLEIGDTVTLSIYRKNGIGIYKEMRLKLEVAGR